MALDIGIGVFPISPLHFADDTVLKAEKAGLHSIMVPDHLMSWFSEALWGDLGNIASMMPSPHVFLDPLPLIATWAERTENIKFGTAVTDPIRRQPAQLAVTSLTLNHLSKGRFILGIGCGEAENCLPYGIEMDRPVARLDEALTIIRLMWEEDRVTFEGRFWNLRDAVCRVPPYDGLPPEIWVGAHGPRMLEITGRHADGWLPFMPFTPEEYARRLQVVRRAAEDSGRDPNSIVAGLNTPVCIADSHEESHIMLRSEATRQFLLAMNTDFYHQIGRTHPLGYSEGTMEYIPEWLTERELRTAMEKVPDPLLAHDLVIHGTPAEVAEQLQAYEAAGLQYFAPLDTSPFTKLSQFPGAVDRLFEVARLVNHGGMGR